MRLLFRQPPAVLRPNASAPLDLRAARRVHGMRLQAKKRLRLQAKLMVLSVLRRDPEIWQGFVPVRYDVTWFFWAGVGPDEDNVVASCKALLDGCADGVAHRVDRLKSIGNGQVPLVAAVAFCELKRILELELSHG